MAPVAGAIAVPGIGSVLGDAALLLAMVACVPLVILAVGAPFAILLNLVLRLIALF